MASASTAKPLRIKVREHRERLPEQGRRPIQIWVPDARSPAFRSEAHRQSAAIVASAHAREDQAFLSTPSRTGAMREAQSLRRGEIWTIAGGTDDAGKPRPIVIVQDDSFDATDSLTICAFTTDEIDAAVPPVRAAERAQQPSSDVPFDGGQDHDRAKGDGWRARRPSGR